MTPEAKLRAIKAALAEIGRPDARCTIDTDGDTSVALSGPGAVSDAECWMAHFIVDPDGTSCWPCWNGDDGGSCTHDPRREPRPQLTR